MNQQIPTLKKKAVEDLANLIKSNKTVLVASIKDIPTSQFQEISKKLRGKVIIKVPKKNLIFRAIDSLNDEELKKLKKEIKENTAILFSNLDSFELAAELTESKKPVKAKIGQESPEDIEIPAGPTDLMAGPAVSELGALGIKIQIEDGKITIKEPKIIIKKGGKVSENAASIMNKLNIMPFSISFIPKSAYDTQEKKLYINIKIDKEETLDELKTGFSKALSFAIEIGYTCKKTIGFLLSKAWRNEKALEKFGENIQQNKSESNSEQGVK